MAAWYKRSEWLSTRSGCTTKFVPSDVRGVAIHYPGGNIPDAVAAGNKAATAQYLRGVRTMQMQSTAYDYCDIEYNLAVDRAGNVWDLRGRGRRGGANGTTESNARYVSVFVIVGLTSNAKPTDEQVAGIRRAVRGVRDVYGADAKAIRPHSAFKATACPGVPLHALIKDGSLEPGSKLRERIDAATARIKALLRQLTRARGHKAELKDKL